MEGAALAPPRQVARQGYLILTILLGIAGSGIAMAAFAHGSYRVGPLIVEMSVKPATKGTTQVGSEFARLGLQAGTAKAETHAGFLALKGTITGLYSQSISPQAVLDTQDPLTLAKTIRDQGKTAVKKVLLRVALVVIGGGAAGGAVVALIGLKTRRVFQGLLAGIVVVGVLGLIAWKTYDIDKFATAKFSAPGVALLQR